MEIAKLLVTLIGYLAWPVVACVIGLRVVNEFKTGLLGKLVNPGGTLEVGGVKLTVANIEEANQNVQAIGISLETPSYAEDATEENIENLTPYEIVMTAWSDLAEIITQLSLKFNGYDDRRQVWSNIEILCENEVIDRNTMDAVRALQSARNGIRRTGSVSRYDAKDYARSAYSLKNFFDKKSRI